MWVLLIFPWLYYWLRGHWFARVLAMFFWAPTVLFMAKKPLDTMMVPEALRVPLGLLTVASCLVVAWLISSLPTYVKVRREGSGRALALR